MKIIRKILTVKNDTVRIRLPKGMKGQKVEVLITPVEDHTQPVQQEKYDFSDLVGKLTWTGDAVLEQRRLRDEW